MRKIRVEFEIEADEVKRLIEASKKDPKVISDEELKELAKAGTIRAADYLGEDQGDNPLLPVYINKLVSKASQAENKISNNLSNKTVQRFVVSDIIDKCIHEKPTPDAEANDLRKR